MIAQLAQKCGVKSGRIDAANSFPYRYKGVHDEHSDFAIHRLGSRRRQGNVRLCASAQNPIRCPLPRQPERDVSPLTAAHCLRGRKNDRHQPHHHVPACSTRPAVVNGVAELAFAAVSPCIEQSAIYDQEYYAVSSACARACGYRVLGWPCTWPETSERITS